MSLSFPDERHARPRSPAREPGVESMSRSRAQHPDIAPGWYFPGQKLMPIGPIPSPGFISAIWRGWVWLVRIMLRLSFRGAPEREANARAQLLS